MKVLTDKDMKKKMFMDGAVISSFSVSKLNRGENIIMDVLGKIGKALNCRPDNICEFEDHGR